MKKLSTYLKKNMLGYLFGILCIIISVTLDMLSPQLTRKIIDKVIGENNLSLLSYLLLGILGIGIGRSITTYFKEYLFDISGSKIAAHMRQDIFLHIQGLSSDFFDKNSTGELMARVKEDIDRIWESLTYVGMLIIEVLIHTCMVLFCMYTLSWKLALIPTFAMIICGLLAILLEKKLDTVYEEISEANAKLNTIAEENLGGIRTVKAFAREKFEIKKFFSHNQRYFDLNMEQSRVFVKYHPLFSLVTKILPIIILLVGGYYVINGELTLGALAAFIQYSMNIVWPMEMLGWLTNSLSSAFGSKKKIDDIYKETTSITEKEEPIILDQIKGKIEFKNVSYIRDETKILKNISFTLQPGKTLGIMGPTGAGKSSLIFLLQRLYDSSNGTIYLDDVDIKDLSLKQLRSGISTVMQDVFLFSDTINDNIKLGKQNNLSKEIVKEAASSAQAMDFIERLINKYDTVIGERGVGLSGGQKQRLSLARALAKDTPILVLDDSTSALDMETEHLIHQTLNNLQNTSKIIIAHRISAIRHADEIIYLEHGEIKERGTHDTLLAKKELYYKTYMAQYGEFLVEKEAICQ